MKTYTVIPEATIKSALTKLGEYIQVTYGAAGKAILVDYGIYQKVLDDGFLAIDEFELPDPLENAVIKLVKEVSAKANKRAGDGTTTATLLMIALVLEVLASPKVSRNFAIKEIQIAAKEAVEKMRAAKKDIETIEDLENVALNAYKDEDIAETIANMLWQVGKDGLLVVEESQKLETDQEISMGMAFDKGFISAYFSNDGEGEVCELKEPAILITTKRITTMQELMPVMEKLMNAGKKTLLIVAESVEGEALTSLIMNKLRGVIEVVAVRAPYTGQQRKDFLEDLAAVTHATVVDEERGDTLEKAELEVYGAAKSLKVTKDSTLIVGGYGDNDYITQRLEAAKKGEDKERIARLGGGIGIIRVGAATESETKTKRAKVEDAARATQLAYKTGVVSGGAQAFLVETSSPYLNTALKYPRTILEQNGKEAIDEGAQDAFGVVEAALESAVSMAVLLLNTGGIITTVNGDKDQH